MIASAVSAEVGTFLCNQVNVQLRCEIGLKKIFAKNLYLVQYLS
jgi:hypothetical protein